MKTVITHPDFSNNNIKHAFLTKNIGGTHKYIIKDYNDCNDENLAEIKQNNQVALGCLNAKARKLNFVNQAHTNKVIYLENDLAFMDEPIADAMVTDKPNIALGIMTADCVPVLFQDFENKIIGAAHAGWRGARSDILQNTYQEMRDLGARRIYACIGPCIKQENYEIGPEFYSNFLEETEENIKFFIPSSKEGHFLFNLTAYVTAKLERLNIQVENINHDTFGEKANFISYRRYQKNKNEEYGSNLSLIVIEDAI